MGSPRTSRLESAPGRKPVTIVALLALLAVSLGTSAATYRWVDEKGRVHYGDTQPAQARVQAMLDNQGRVRTRPQPALDPAAEAARRQQEATEADIRQRHDRALLSTYVDESEIDQARGRAVEHEQAKILGLQVHMENTRQRLGRLNAEIADYKRRGLRVPVPVVQMRNDAQEQIIRLSDMMLISNKAIEAIGARYEADKQRFRELKGRPP